MSVAPLVQQSEGLTLVLAFQNSVQVVLLAWIASRGTRRRRGDRPKRSED